MILKNNLTFTGCNSTNNRKTKTNDGFRPLNIFYLIVIFSLILLPQFILAQTARIIPGKSSISINDEFTLTIIAPISKQLKTSAFPEISDFSKKQTEYLREDSVFRIIQHYKPRKAGTSQLTPFTFYVNNQKIPFASYLNISVKPAKKRLQEEVPASPFTESELVADLIISSDKNEVVTGQGFTVMLSLLIEPGKGEYNFIDIKDQYEKIARNMLPQNCIAENLSVSGSIPRDSVTLGQKSYTRYTLYKATFYPITAAPVVFKRVSFNLLTYDEYKKSGLIIRKDHMLSLVSNSLSVKVKPVPGNEFSGLAGRFFLKEKVTGREPVARKNFIYSFVIEGEGNLSMAQEPALNTKGKNIEVYPVIPPKTEPGRITFTYKIIPENAGILSLDSVFSWPYYNISSQKTDTLISHFLVTIKSSVEIMDTTYAGDPFYSKINLENNKLKSLQKDYMLKLFTNLVILFMFAVTAILIIRK